MKKVLFLIVGLIICAGSAFAQIVDPSSPLQLDPEVRYGKLDNGLTYYIRYNNKPEQRAEFFLVTNVGAIEETPAQDGLAHFLEHMALNGSKNLPGKMMLEYFAKIGVEFGRNINASTGVEQTMYMLNNIPVHRQGIIDTALLVMHDYSAFVTNAGEEIDAERGVIIEEWRTRRTADWRMYEQVKDYLYKGSKYADCTIIGSKENLETFPHEELRKFYETWYRPDLQALIVVGDIDVDAIEAQIKSLFADIPARENPAPKIAHKIPNNEEAIVGIITDPEASSTSIQVVFKTDPFPIEYRPLGIYKMNDIMLSLIRSMFSERLQDIAKKPNAPFFGASIGFTSFTQTMDGFSVGVSAKDGEGVKALTAAMAELERAKLHGFTAAEFDRAKTNMLRRLERAAENADSRQNGELVYDYLYNFLYHEPFVTPKYDYETTQGYLSIIGIDQLNSSLKMGIPETNAVIIYQAPEREGLVHPTENELVEILSAVKSMELEPLKEEVSNEPLMDDSILKGSPVKKVKPTVYGATEWTLKNGIKVMVKPTDYKKEEVLMSVNVKGGKSLVSEADLSSVDGNIFSFWQNNAGVSKFPSTELRKKLTGKLVSVRPFITELGSGISAQTSPKDFETMMQLVYLTAVEPRFVESEYDVAMNQLKNMLPNLLKQPDFVFQTEWMKIIHDNNPRAKFIDMQIMEEASVNTLERIYRELFGNFKDAQVVIVGNVNPDEIKPLVEKYIGSLPVGKKPLKWVDQKVDVAKGKKVETITVEMTTPKSTVGMIASGKVPYTEENLVYANAMSYILDLIYTKTIREDEGGTYGVGAQVSLGKDPENEGMVMIRFDTNEEMAAKLAQLAKDGLYSLAENGPDAEQLTKAKENMLKNIPENRIRNQYWAGQLEDYYQKGIDNDGKIEAIVKDLTAEKVQAFAKMLLDQGNFIELTMFPAK